MSDLEAANFVREFTAAHAREVGSGLQKEYRLYHRKAAPGDHTIFIPPDAVHLAEQTPTWGKQLKQLFELPNLKGCSEVRFGQSVPPTPDPFRA